jgi:shikimate dehydrogenase/3-dehydroquinate dehydratase type I
MIREARSEILGPTIATLRSKVQGGRSGLEGSKREDALKEILESDFEYVDIELETDRSLLKKGRGTLSETQIIVSCHFLRPVSRGVVEKKLVEAMKLGDIAKVAMPCETAPQALDLVQLGLKFSRLKKRFVIIGMGLQGQLTRVFADRIGSELVYACLPGKEAAPGQLDVAAQISILQGPRKVFGLVGHPVSHSVSKPMQEEALKHLGLRGAYLPLDFPQKEFDGNALRALKNLGLDGLNVTIPHKGLAFKLCDRRGESATATRAVNTISFVGKTVVGENTDVIGFSRLLDEKTTITPNTAALVIGAGGAARAVAYVLSERKARLTIIDIEKGRADELAKTFGGKSATVKRLWKSDRSFDLVVNCTPVGMKGMAGTPLKAGFVGPGSVFIDIIYNPPMTKAMELATSRGAKAYGGLEMLVQQGAESFRIWTGLEPSVDAMRAAAGRSLQ